jgi:hypothetical protein
VLLNCVLGHPQKVPAYLATLEGASGNGGGNGLSGGAAAKAAAARARRVNPADLLLDVASSAACQRLAAAVADGSFAQPAGGGRGSAAWAAAPLCLDATSSVPPSAEPGGRSRGASQALDDDDDLLGGDEEATGRGSGPGRFELPPSGRPSAKRNGFCARGVGWAARGVAALGLGSRPRADGSGEPPFPKRHVASVGLQIAALSSRLVLTSARHPMLLLLQYAGCFFLAVCVGFIFFDLEDDL